MNHAHKLDREILKTVLKGASRRPLSSLPSSSNMVIYQFRQSRKRRKADVTVPPTLMISVTSRCNLHCKGCYHRAKMIENKELDLDILKKTITEFESLGTSIFIIAGGEPMMRWNDIHSVMIEHHNALFLMFTNGTLIDPQIMKQMRDLHNLVVVISQEGSRSHTDARRGAGIYEKLTGIMLEMKKMDICFGTSLTISKDNLYSMTGDDSFTELIESGSQFLAFVEYVPLQPGTESSTLDDIDRRFLLERLKILRQRNKAIVLGFPGDEEQFDGCLAAGRGFLHLSCTGDIEACPAAPFSDMNIRNISVHEALRSPLMKQFREIHHLLKEGQGGCTLWSNRDYIQQEFLGINSENRMMFTEEHQSPRIIFDDGVMEFSKPEKVST